MPRASQSASLTGGLISLKLPLTLRICEGKFQLIDHEGCLLIELSAAELMAVSQYARPTAFSEGLKNQHELLAGHSVDEPRLIEILDCLYSAGLILMAGLEASEYKQDNPQQAVRERFSRQASELDKEEALREKETGVIRPKVIPVSFGDSIPAALGLIIAYAKKHGDLDEFYNFRRDWVWDDARMAGFTSTPAIYLFSNYLWTHENGIAVSESVKRLSPDSITIHGGPDTPKYEEDAEAYFAQFPHVDVIIRGEGEASATETLDRLRGVIGQANPDLSVLEGVAGVSYRDGDKIIRNPDRPRIEDLDSIPSPYLMGLFDSFKDLPRLHVNLETNRGCPYGCTFCDWGSATASKIRKFDIERVFGELKWCSEAKVQSVSQADANFGIFERDVSITECVAELKTSTGYPETFGGSYAKNSTKYLQKIIKILAEAGILAQGVLSLQTMDDNTLSAIKRSNIKVEKYDALANEMRDSDLQLSVELMMGLPGATLKSFIEDLQQCIDRDIQARINHTTMLVNSPMNSPDYRAEYQIETVESAGLGQALPLVSTSTYSRDDLSAMMSIADVFKLLDNFGVLRLCSRFVRQQTGLTEMDFYQKLLFDIGAPKQEIHWPILNSLMNSGKHLMAPVYSWALVIEEVHRFLLQECGVPDDSALDAILVAQHALLPAHDRVYPFEVELQHDVVAWHSQMIEAKAAGRGRDWESIVAPLSSFGKGRLEVNDIDGAVSNLLGCDIIVGNAGANWDMDSGIGRAKLVQEANPAWAVGALRASDEGDIIQVG